MNPIELFISKKDMTRWTLNDAKAMLPINDYYKALYAPYVFECEVQGYNSPRGVENQVSIYSAGNKYVAQVASKVQPSSGSVIKRVISPELSIATYYAYNDKIIILNRFDAKGFPHQNNYDIYTTNRDLYEKYFTDYYKSHIKDGKETQIPYVYTPHFHFNTRAQTSKLGNQEKANAISIDGLILYLMDLKKCKDKNDVIWQDSLGMPFLDYATNKVQYNSLLLNLLNDVVNSTSTSYSDNNIKVFMGALIHRASQRGVNNIQNIHGMKSLFDTNIDKILLDLRLLKRIIADLGHQHDFVLECSKAVMKSINAMGYVQEFKYEQ